MTKYFKIAPSSAVFSLRLGKPQEHKVRPIRIIFGSPVECDAACYFILSNMKLLQA